MLTFRLAAGTKLKSLNKTRYKNNNASGRGACGVCPPIKRANDLRQLQYLLYRI